MPGSEETIALTEMLASPVSADPWSSTATISTSLRLPFRRPGKTGEAPIFQTPGEKIRGLPVVVMLSDPNEPVDDVPETAAWLVKPFDRTKLERAMDEARRRA